jgi:hypothetical protein
MDWDDTGTGGFFTTSTNGVGQGGTFSPGTSNGGSRFTTDSNTSVAGTSAGGATTRSSRHFVVRDSSRPSNYWIVNLDENHRLSSSVLAMAKDSFTSGISLSPNGRWAVIGDATATLVDMNRAETTPLTDLGISRSTIVERGFTWLGDSRLFVDTPLDAAYGHELAILKLGETAESHQVVAYDLDVALSHNVSPDGRWLLRSATSTGKTFTWQLIALEETGFGSNTHEALFSASSSATTFWSSDSKIVTLYDNSTGQVQPYRIASTIDKLPVVFFQTDVNFSYSTGNRYLVGTINGGSIPAYFTETTETGLVRYLDPLDTNSVWNFGPTNRSDDGVLWTRGGQLAYTPLRDVQGNELTEAYVEQSIRLYDPNLFFSEVAFVGNTKTVVCLVYDTSASVASPEKRVFLVDFGAIAPTFVDLSQLVGSERLHAYAVAPRGDVVALVTDHFVHFASIGLNQVNYATTDIDSNGNTQIAWAPDDSGLIVATPVPEPRIHFIPRDTVSGGFGLVETLPISTPTPFELLYLELPNHWN